MKFERHILLRASAAGLIPAVIALAVIWTQTYSLQSRVTLTLAIVLPGLGFAFSVRSKIVYPLRTLTNLMEALREGDYSLRLRGAAAEDALGELILEINLLAQSLQARRFNAIETTALLRKTLAQIDVALFGFDQETHLCLINDSGCDILGQPEKSLLGQSASDLGLAACLTGETPRILELALPGGVRRWECRRTSYREQGVNHPLVVLSDLTRTLHEEERLAWKRLIQILRHEINNSLTPIQSVAQTLKDRVTDPEQAAQWQPDVHEGLEIIASRSEELGKFIKAYSQLTRLPDPVFESISVREWVQHAVGLETRIAVVLEEAEDIILWGDRGQLDQLLINLIANAVEATLECHHPDQAQVTVTWQCRAKNLRLIIQDNGPGLDENHDVFVPFFTTKSQGCGIGLALSRQIAEAHNGYLTLENQTDTKGCIATLCLPL